MADATYVPDRTPSSNVTRIPLTKQSSSVNVTPSYADAWYGLYGDAYGLAQDLTYKQNMDSAKTQMDFQQFMSDTAHQREVNDLLAAGLNPVLSANNGASTGQGAYANVDTSASSSKMAEKQLNKQLENQTKIENMKIANEQKIADQNRQMQYKIAQDQILSQQYISKYNADMSYALGTYQSDNNLRGTTYSADSAKQASIYGTDKNYQNNAEQRVWQAGQYKLERDWQTEEAKAQRSWQGEQNKYDRRISKYGIDRGYDASIYGANSSKAAASISASATRYAALQSYLAAKYGADMNFTTTTANNRNKIDLQKMKIMSDPTAWATWLISNESNKTASKDHGAYYFGY